MGEGAHLAGDGGQHAVGAGTRHAQAGVQGRDEGGRAGCVDPEQPAAAASDDGVSGEDFTAVRHGLQPSDRARGLADRATPPRRAFTRSHGVHGTGVIRSVTSVDTHALVTTPSSAGSAMRSECGSTRTV